MIITISGPPGSGKSTVAKAVAKELGLTYVSVSKIYWDLVEEKGSYKEVNQLAESDPGLDKKIDERQLEYAKKGNAIIEGRLSGWLIKNADLKIWLDATQEDRALRMAQRNNSDSETALEELKEREASESKRYKEYYGIDISDLSIYDLIINTSKWDAKSVTSIILNAVKEGKEWK